MLKKKNIAMVMAAATVATSVAPVFASSVERKSLDEETLISTVEELLNTKYSDAEEDGDGNPATEATGENAYTNSVYTIESNLNKEGKPASPAVTITNISDLKEIIEGAKVDNATLTLTVTDKGHKEVNGQIVAGDKNKYAVYTDLNSNIYTHGKNPQNIAKVGASIALGSNDQEGTIILANGKQIDLVVGDYVLDFEKPLDANGNPIQVPATGLSPAIAQKVDSFELYEAVSTARPMDIPSRKVAELTYTNVKTKVDMDINDIYYSKSYTQTGVDFINAVNTAVNGKDVVVKDGTKYDLENAVVGSVNVAKDGGYTLSVTLKAWKTGTTKPNNNNVKITISGMSEKDLNTVKAQLSAVSVTATAQLDKLAGEDRFETAISVSKSSFASKADAVVLVGENAIVDGLAAAPLASQKNAPILLSKKDAITYDTMNEIKRVLPANGDVYIIGGENTISEEVEKQLIKEVNANIIRLSGDDRYETSLEIAEEISKVAPTKAFVVGGDGLADAMSVSAVASKKTTTASGATQVTPIIVTPAEGLTKDAKEYLKDTTSITNVNVVGGVTKVDTQVLKDIKASSSTIASVNRTAGADRSETNAKVIAENYTTNTLKNVYVAKDGDTQLIDALAAAPMVGTNNGAIVLATNDITDAQERAILAATNDQASDNKLTQIGNGVAGTLMKKMVQLLGL